MTLDVWGAFVLASVVVLVLPGPTIVTMTSYAMAYGRRMNGLLVAAVALGDATAVTVSLLGVGALLAASPFWFEAVRWAGACYLIYLGARMLRGRAAAWTADDVSLVSRRRLFASMYAITALNPKGVVFYVGFLPQFVDPGAGTGMQLLVLGSTFIALAAANAAAYAAGASFVRRSVFSSAVQSRFHRVGGSVLVGAGVWALSLGAVSQP